MFCRVALALHPTYYKVATRRLGAATQERNPTTNSNTKTRCPSLTICGMLGCAPKKEIADEGPMSLHPTYY